MTVTRIDPRKRALAKFTVGDGCWLWTGGRQNGGYGAFWTGRQCTGFAHRFVYEWLVGPIPDGLTLDHLCRVRHCVRPDHLEPVTPRVNTLRGGGPSAHNAAKTHCPQGHAYDEANTYVYRNGRRKCRTCRRTNGMVPGA